MVVALVIVSDSCGDNGPIMFPIVVCGFMD